MRLSELSQVEVDILERVSGISVEHSAMAVMSNTWRTARAFEQLMERGVLREHGLTFAGFNTLFIVWVWAPVETREIARLSGVTRATVSNNVAGLERQDLVTRSPSPEDRRLVCVDLTTKGRALIERLFPEFNKVEQEITSCLSAQEQETLTESLRKIQRAIAAQEGAMWSKIA